MISCKKKQQQKNPNMHSLYKIGVWHYRKWSFNVYVQSMFLLGYVRSACGVKRCASVYSFAYYYYFSCAPSCLHHQASLCFIGPFTEVCSKTWRASVIKPPWRREYRNFFFFFIRRGQRKKKILKLKWGNSTNYHLSQSNPVTIAKNMERCKHGNRLLIWM